MWSLDDWPRQCGFEYVVGLGRWVRGDLHLRKVSSKYWVLYRSPDALIGERIATRCTSGDAIVADLTLQLREKTGAPQ